MGFVDATMMRCGGFHFGKNEKYLLLDAYITDVTVLLLTSCPPHVPSRPHSDFARSFTKLTRLHTISLLPSPSNIYPLAPPNLTHTLTRAPTRSPTHSQTYLLSPLTSSHTHSQKTYTVTRSLLTNLHTHPLSHPIFATIFISLTR